MEQSRLVLTIVCIIFSQSILAGVRYTIRFSWLIRSRNIFWFQKNKLTFERLHCPKTSPGSVAQSFNCILKHVSRTNLKIHVGWKLTRPVQSFWMHSVFYYKFNGITFHKFPIDLTEDLCGWINGTGKSFAMDWSLGKMLKYTNVNHTCPYVGPMWLKVDNIPEETLTFDNSLIPSGEYRVDYEMLESPASNPFLEASLYFSVSDHRLEIV